MHALWSGSNWLRFCHFQDKLIVFHQMSYPQLWWISDIRKTMFHYHVAQGCSLSPILFSVFINGGSGTGRARGGTK